MNHYKQDRNELISVLKAITKYSCPKDINFHCHTINSDGSLNPIDLLNNSKSIGLKHLAITDHHSVKSYLEIQTWLKSNNIINQNPRLWSGIEISCLLKGCLVHILGLGFDPNSKHLIPYIQAEPVTGHLLQAHSVIKAIQLAKGLAFLAHPARYRLNFGQLIEEANNLGIDGIEVWYDYDMSSKWQPTPYLCNSISEIVLSNGLLPTCGTDTHWFTRRRPWKNDRTWQTQLSLRHRL